MGLSLAATITRCGECQENQIERSGKRSVNAISR